MGSVLLLGCGDSDDSGDDVNQSEETNGDECHLDLDSEFNFLHTLPPDWIYFPNTETMEHHRVLSHADAQLEEIGARIEDGELRVWLDEGQIEGALRVNIRLPPSNGELNPGEAPVGYDHDGGITFSLMTTYHGPDPPCCSYTESLPASDGVIEFTDCPTQVGERLRGNLNTSYDAGAFSPEGHIEGSFDVALLFSDGTIDCAEAFQPQICE